MLVAFQVFWCLLKMWHVCKNFCAEALGSIIEGKLKSVLMKDHEINEGSVSIFKGHEISVCCMLCTANKAETRVSNTYI